MVLFLSLLVNPKLPSSDAFSNWAVNSWNGDALKFCDAFSREARSAKNVLPMLKKRAIYIFENVFFRNASPTLFASRPRIVGATI